MKAGSWESEGVGECNDRQNAVDHLSCELGAGSAKDDGFGNTRGGTKSSMGTEIGPFEPIVFVDSEVERVAWRRDVLSMYQ